MVRLGPGETPGGFVLEAAMRLEKIAPYTYLVNLVRLALLLNPELIHRMPPATGAEVHPGHQALTLQGGDS
jgi:hypothetical protein